MMNFGRQLFGRFVSLLSIFQRFHLGEKPSGQKWSSKVQPLKKMKKNMI